MNFQIGDSVSWYVKQGGQQTAVLVDVQDNTGYVLNWLGERERVSVSSLHEVNDTRMKNLRILDIEDPGEAKLAREKYLNEYTERVKKNGSYVNAAPASDGDAVKRRNRRNSDLVESLTKDIVEAVLENGESSKSQILEKIGQNDISPSLWNKAIEAALQTRKVARKGKKRGTRYYNPKEG